jgi:hypothetical protein
MSASSRKSSGVDGTTHIRPKPRTTALIGTRQLRIRFQGCLQSARVGWNRVSIADVKLERGKRVVFKVDSLRIYPSMWSIVSDK